MKKIICSIICIMLVGTTTIITYATGNLSEINQKIDKAKEEINEVKDKMSDNLKEVNKLVVEINNYESQIETLNKEMTELDASITEKTQKLAEAEQSCKEQEELLQQRLVVLYESGETTYLDVLLGADSILDLISTYYLVTEIAQHDTELLEKLENTKTEIEVAKQSLEETREKVEAAKASKQAAADGLKSAKSTKDKYARELSEEEKSLQKSLEEMEQDKKIIEEQIRKAMQNSNQPVYTGNGQLGWPVPGVYYVSCEYGGYAGHAGMDIAAREGTPIVAAENGVVVTSGKLTNSNGTYRSYGEYIIINHGSGIMTLYAHGSPNSRKVSPGDVVTRGQTIMLVGNTGNSTGAHLHFEVRINNVAQNPRKYL